MAVNRVKLLRKIGISQKLFSRAQWKDAEAEAEARGGEVASLLVGLGFVSKDQLRGLERAVDYRIGRDEDKSLAKVIVDSGYADAATVESALRQQKDLYGKTGELARICDLLMNGGTLSESQHLAARKIHEIARLAEKDDGSGADEASGGPAPGD